MVKKFTLLRMLIWFAAAVALTVFFINCIRTGFSGYFTSNLWMDDNMHVVQEKSYSPQGIEKIDLMCPSANVYVSRTNEPEIKLVYKIVGNMNEETDILTVYYKNIMSGPGASSDENDGEDSAGGEDGDKSLRIEQPDYKSGLMVVGQAPLKQKLEIYLPEAFESEIKIHASAGDVKFAYDFNFSRVEVLQNDGSLETEELKAESFYYFNTKGGLNMQALETSAYTVRMSGGDLVIGALRGSGELATHEGNIDIGLLGLPGASTVSTTSGDISVRIGRQIKADISAQSGSFTPTADFKLTYNDDQKRSAKASVGDEPRVALSLVSNTGHIEITK
ncbi:MAG TPA: hypothetical protein DEQ02_04320 [Ruminococcaceae bacterium]|nr:hypothetical protein [Oscillospiraceae bacterium]